MMKVDFKNRDLERGKREMREHAGERGWIERQVTSIYVLANL